MTISLASGVHAQSAQGEWGALNPEGDLADRTRAHSAIYDPQNDRMIVFGGESVLGGRWGPSSNTWALDLGESPKWTQIQTSTSPGATLGASAVYDPARNRMLVFGGYGCDGDGCDFSNDVWALSLGGTPAWERLQPQGTPPPPRMFTIAVYDAVGDRMIIFGGLPGTPVLRDVWALSLSRTPTWTELTPTGSAPSGRWGHVGVYDPVSSRLVVYGGFGPDNTTLDDTWMLSLTGIPEWTAVAPTDAPRPAPLLGASAVYDPIARAMLIYGGVAPTGINSGETWSLSLDGVSPSWTLETPGISAPPFRRFHTAVYRSAVPQMVIFGGFDNGFGFYNDTWALRLLSAPEAPENQIPDCSRAKAITPELWPPNHVLSPVEIVGVTDPDGDPVTISVLRITQDEAVGDGSGAVAHEEDLANVPSEPGVPGFARSGSTACPDGQIVNGMAYVRVERSGRGNGRVYRISFKVTDGRGGDCTGMVNVGVPHDRGKACIDDGQLFNSLELCSPHKRNPLSPEGTVLFAPTLATGMTVLEYELAEDGEVDLAVYDIAGRRVTTIEKGAREAGYHTVSWNTSGVSKGVYFLRFRTASTSITARLPLH